MATAVTSVASATARRARQSIGLRGEVCALALVTVLVAVTYAWGKHVVDRHPEIHVNAPPFVGTYEAVVTWRVLIPLAIGGVVVVASRRVVTRLPWLMVCLVAMVAAAAWALALAFIDGGDAISQPLRSRYDYLAGLSLVESPGSFVAGFTDMIRALPNGVPTHVQSHPPGMPLLLWGMDRLGFAGAGPAAVVVVAAGAATVAAVLVSVRAIAGEEQARRAAPLLVLAPAALWIATSADALFMGVGAWGVALVLLAMQQGGRADVRAGAGGLLLGMAAYLSYALVLLWTIPVAVGASRRNIRPVFVAGCGALFVALVFTVSGFWWFDGLFLAREKYAGGISHVRPYGYFLVANLVAFAVMLGPAAIAGFTRLRRNGVGVLILPVLAAVALANLSGLSKGEVERIWLPFAAWAAAAATALGPNRWWLTAQAGTGLGLAVLLRSPW